MSDTKEHPRRVVQRVAAQADEISILASALSFRLRSLERLPFAGAYSDCLSDAGADADEIRTMAVAMMRALHGAQE